MSWLFSQALVEASSAVTSSDGQPSAQLNVMPTQHKFWRNDKTMEPSSLSRFGLTCAVLTEGRGQELLTSYLAGFRARTSALQGGVKDLTAHGRDSGESSRGWFATFDPDSSTWRTAQRSLLGDSELFLETWPRWGSMRDGVSCLRPTPALPICESEFGLWPTPNVPNGGRAMSKEMALNGGYTEEGKKRQVDLGSAVRYWPTPVASDTGRRSKPYAQGGTALSLAIKLWPTPTASDWRSGKASQVTHDKNSRPLREAVTKYPTPSTIGINGGSHSRAAAVKRGQDVKEVNGGSLNPTWVEWLMGWPLGWTDLKPLAMDRFQEFVQQHGECSEASK